jgi:hypothetical protein
LEVRQAIGGIKRAMIFDEIEHLGAYIRDNRFDITIQEHLKRSDRLAVDSMGDLVDRHFEAPDWNTRQPPQQAYPDELARILAAVDRYRPSGWLAVDSSIRNLGGVGRTELAGALANLRPTLAGFPQRRIVYGVEEPLQIWLCRAGHEPSLEVVQYQAQIAAVLCNARIVRAIILSYNGALEITHVDSLAIGPPSAIQKNYSDLLREVEIQRGRIKPVKKSD